MLAAVDLFLTKGFAATSLEEIVARSGGSLATVYQLFGSKQGLWQALVQERTQQLTAPLRDPSPAVHDNPREVLLQMARSLMNLVR
ncbi:MAG: TetR/AcrR family transcriptional regulator, partial [Rhodospirillaceae bacterium]|nr:TetR/AcrR family transcriptional regulator [Rhodospirillaceae bacterium]